MEKALFAGRRPVVAESTTTPDRICVSAAILTVVLGFPAIRVNLARTFARERTKRGVVHRHVIHIANALRRVQIVRKVRQATNRP